jgi:hypothetical protein
VLFVDNEMPRNAEERTTQDFGSLLVAAYRRVCPHGIVVLISQANFGGGDKFMPKMSNFEDMNNLLHSLIRT